MILVTMGTQPLKCNRIIDAIINADIKENIIIQAYFDDGEYSDSDNIKFIKFIPYSEMDELINKADIVVTSGTGSIVRALLKNKKVIIFPRLKKYKEAIDEHGNDMIILKDLGYAEFVEENDSFKEVYERTKSKRFKKFSSNNKYFTSKLLDELAKL